MINSFNVWLHGNVLIHFSLLKNSMLDIEFLVGRVFFPCILKMSFHCFWWELAVNIIEELPMCLSLLSCGFMVLSLPLAFDSLIMMCLGEFIELVLWNLMFLINLGIYSAIISSNTLSAPFSLFWDTHYAYIDMFYGVPYISRSVHFLHSFSLFLWLDNLSKLFSTSLILLSSEI